MTHGSLFSGVGGFDLAAEWAGWENVFHCEWNEFGRKVLNYYWPDAESFGDIHDIHFKNEGGIVYVRGKKVTSNTNNDGCKWVDCEHEVKPSKGRVDALNDIEQTDIEYKGGSDVYEWKSIGTVDVISGGFPCQPYSMAGKRKGKEDDRHLWPEMLRVIKQVKPTWVVGENVYGLVNWSDGLVFHEIISDLEGAGYEVQPYLIPAVGVDAPHRRDRLWIVAHSANYGHERGICNGKGRSKGEQCNTRIGKRFRNEIGSNGLDEFVANTGLFRQEVGQQQSMGVEQLCKEQYAPDTNGSIGREGWMHKTRPEETERYISTRNPRINKCTGWENFPTKPPVCSRNDGLSPGLVGITVSKHRNESIKAYGNAIVPQVVYQIFKSINEYNEISD